MGITADVKNMSTVRYHRYNSQPLAVFTDLEGCLMDDGCKATNEAIKQLFREKGVDITDEEAGSGCDTLVGTDNTSKKSHLRHVLLQVCKDKWQAVTGAAPTEWDLEALFKEFARAIRDEVHKVKPVRGAVEVATGLQARGIKVAIASDFNAEAMDPWMRVAHANKFEVDGSMSCADVPNPGREGGFACVPPEPWRCLALAARLGIYPMDTCVRVSHTMYGIEEGLNAGMWTIACATTGPAVPLNGPGDTEALKAKRIQDGFYKLGCHYVIDGIWDLPAAMADIEAKMARGVKP